MSEEYRGRFFEDFEAGHVYRSWLGRTVTEADNVWFANLTMNTNQMHFNREWAERSEFGQPLVVSTFTLALVARARGSGHIGECGGQPRLERHQAAEAGFRRRHALGRERGVGGSRVEEPAFVRNRLDPDSGNQSAARGRHRVRADVHGVSPRRSRGRERISGNGGGLDGPLVGLTRGRLPLAAARRGRPRPRPAGGR